MLSQSKSRESGFRGSSIIKGAVYIVQAKLGYSVYLLNIFDESSRTMFSS